MHPLTRHILRNNDAVTDGFTTLVVGGMAMGLLHPEVAAALAGLLKREGDALRLPHDETRDGRDKDLKDILALLIEKQFVRSERFELYAIAPSFGDEPLALADRGLLPVLGFPAHGIHCNGYVVSEDHMKLWVGKRSSTTHVEPGKLDHIVAGGQPYGLTLEENLAKEAKEEAAIPAPLLKAAKRAGAIRYAKAEKFGLRRDTLFIFDLPLPADFTPRNTDGETESFQLLDTAEVRRIMETSDAFKFNVPLVLIDFFIRHGLIKPDEPGFAELAAGLRKTP